MSKTVLYHRRGWQAKEHQLADLDKKTGLCKIANEKGEILVQDLPYVENPSEVDPAELPKSYASPVGAPPAGKKQRKKAGAAEGGEDDPEDDAGAADGTDAGPGE